MGATLGLIGHELGEIMYLTNPKITLQLAHYIKIEMAKNKHGNLGSFNFTFNPGEINEKNFIVEMPPDVAHDLCNFMGKLKHFIEREPDE